MILRWRYQKLLLFLLFLVLLSSVWIIFLTDQNIVFDPKISKDTKIIVYEKMIEEYRRRLLKSTGKAERPSKFYTRRSETQNIDCGRVLKGDKTYIASLTGPNRTPLIEDPNLDMSCEAIRFRISPGHLSLKPLKSGVAFARMIYMDYEFLEKQVQMSFHPDNVFCFAVDKKSPMEFQSKMNKLAECFDNVVVLPATEEYDGNGHNNNLAHYHCMQAALKFPKWNYFIVQENHDVVIKSIYELEKIYELLGGANDVGIGQPMAERLRSWFKFDPRSLKLFRNESMVAQKVLDTPLKTTKSYKQASLSRKAVEWMVRTVDVTDFINQWNQSGHGLDEQWLSTFQANSQLGMPGHFTRYCLEQGLDTDQVTRMTKWHPGNKNVDECGTRTIRHSICILGIEDLGLVARMPNLMFNKMIPSFDYSIVECTAELLHNRTFLGQVDHELDENYYKNMINVLYHKHHLEPGYRLNCTPSYRIWEYKKLE